MLAYKAAPVRRDFYSILMWNWWKVKILFHEEWPYLPNRASKCPLLNLLTIYFRTHTIMGQKAASIYFLDKSGVIVEADKTFHHSCQMLLPPLKKKEVKFHIKYGGRELWKVAILTAGIIMELSQVHATCHFPYGHAGHETLLRVKPQVENQAENNSPVCL